MQLRNSTAALAVLLASMSALGQTTSNNAKSPEQLSPRWFKLSGQARARFEAPAGEGIVTGSQDSYVLSRARLNLTLMPTGWLTLYSEVQDTHTFGYNGSAPASFQDPADLRVAWIQVGGEGAPVVLRAGRQDVHFGAGRLIGYPDWGNSSRSFDALRGTITAPFGRFELLAGSVVLTDGSRFDRHKAGEHIYGSYNTFTRLVPGATVEAYLLAKSSADVVSESGRRGDSVVYSTGGRVAGKLGRADFAGELVRQWGTWSRDSIGTTAGTYTVGWTVGNSARKPRISADFSHASGDVSPTDRKRGTFDVLYGNQQPYFSLTGLLGWRNTQSWRAGVDMNLTRKLRFALDGRDIYLATTQDGLYNGSGSRVVLNRAATSRHVGRGLDAQFTWTLPQSMQIAFGVGKVFAGEYLRQSKKGDYLYPYVSYTKRF